MRIMDRFSRWYTFIIVLSAVVLLTAGSGYGEEISVADTAKRSDYSLKLEIAHAIDRGLAWLEKVQDPGGFWSQADHPALTGLVLTGFMGEPSGRIKADPPLAVEKGYNYLLNSVQPDGGIYIRDLANYNTAVSMMALLVTYDPSYEPVLKKARNFLVGLQSDFDEKGVTDNPFDGGVGYGSRYKHSDMSNTMFALEALHYSKFLLQDRGREAAGYQDLDWEAALTFVQRCQNLPGYNDQPWASNDSVNKGGFVYFPGDSKAGEMKLESGRTALRSYGSISYAGMLSYIYADLDKNDPRVTAVFDWLTRNYTLDENPGMGPQGLFYYYHTMAKALSTYNVDKLKLAGGTEVDWRRDLALRLLNLQKGEGYWVNDNGRWWEKDPVLVTAYSVIIMEILHRGL